MSVARVSKITAASSSGFDVSIAIDVYQTSLPSFFAASTRAGWDWAWRLAAVDKQQRTIELKRYRNNLIQIIRRWFEDKR